MPVVCTPTTPTTPHTASASPPLSSPPLLPVCHAGCRRKQKQVELILKELGDEAIEEKMQDAVKHPSQPGYRLTRAVAEESPQVSMPGWWGEESPQVSMTGWWGEESPQVSTPGWWGEESPQVSMPGWWG